MSNDKWTPEVNANTPCGNIAIGANEDGRLEIYSYFLIGDFPIFHKWQEWDANKQKIIGFSNWTEFPASKDRTYFNNAFSGNLDLFTGLTTVGDSCIQVVTQGAWGLAQTTANGNWPNHISRLGSGPTDQTMMNAMARSSNGSLYAFGVDQGSFNIHYAKQAKQGGSWSWHTINHPKNEGAYAVRVDDWSFRSRLARLSSPTGGIGGDLDGRIEMFYGTPGRIWSIAETVQASDNWGQGGLSQFVNYTNTGDWTVIQNDPSSGGNFAGRLEVFALALSQSGVNSVFHSWQINSNGSTGWSGWKEIPGLNVSLLPTQDTGHLFLKGPLRAARQQNGSIVIFALGVDPAKGNATSLFYIQQNGPHASFRANWVNLDGDNIRAFDVGQNVDGTLLVAINSNGQIFRRQQTAINSDNWTS
jgi:hypothetical protein